jgi:hypothetical protein
MRLLFVWLFGLLLGILAGAAVLYVNPLTKPDDTALAPIVGSVRLQYATAGPSALAFTHGTMLDLDVHPSSMPTLFESALDKTALGVFVLAEESGSVAALASRTSKLSPLTNPVTRGIVLGDNWLVTVPGSGTYFIESESNLWPFLRDTVIDVGMLKRAWSGPRAYRVTIGPALGGAAIVTGASGAYLGAAGTAVDTLRIDGLSRLSELRNPIDGALEVELSAPEPELEFEETLDITLQSP